jgi:6-phospho-3-hexuloisomerase
MNTPDNWSLSAWFRCDLDELTRLLEGAFPVAQEHLGELLSSARRVFVAGQGRSGLVLRMFAMRLMQLGMETFVVGDATTPAIQPGDLLVVFSGSGETEGVVRVGRQAKAAGARVAVITSQPASSLARLADHLTILPGETPKVTAEMSGGCYRNSQMPLASALEQAALLFLDCLVAWLAEQKGQDNAAMMARHANLE